LGEYTLPMGVGATLGGGLAAGANVVLGANLIGVASFDFAAYGAGLLLFVVIAMVATLAPARRALKINPAITLRHE